MTSVTQALGLIGLYVFSFGAWLGVALANLGLLLMLIAVAFDWRRLRATPLPAWWPWLAIFSMLTLALSAWQGMEAHDDVSVEHIKEARRLAMLWLFLLVAWWMAGDPRRVATALLLAALGFVIGRLTTLDHDGGLMILNPSDRPGFGLPTLAFAQYTATLLVSLCLLGPRIQSLVQTPEPRSLITIAWLSAIAACMAALILAEARMVWIATIAVLIPAVAALGLHARIQQANRPARRQLSSRWTLALVAIVILTVVTLNSELVGKRVSAEQQSYAQVLSGDVDAAGYGSVGLRAHAWRYALALIEERPWFGWGPDASRALLADHEEPRMHVLPDFHNTILEFLVTIGIVGTLPFVLAFCVALVALFSALRQRRLPLDLFLIVLGALVLHQLAGLTNSRIVNPDWAHVWLLFGGAAITFATHARAGNQAVTAA